MEDSLKTYDSLDIEVISISSYFYPVQLEILLSAQKRIRKNEKTTALNALLIIATTSFLESIIVESVRDVILNTNTDLDNKILKNMVRHAEDLLENSTFSSYDKISKEILGYKLKHFTTDEIWEGVEIMFNLRNKIAHGRGFKVNHTIDSNEKSELRYSSNIKKIVDYLRKMSLIHSDIYNYRDILSVTTTEHFINLGKQFFKSITQNISTTFETDTYDKYSNLRSLLAL